MYVITSLELVWSPLYCMGCT